MMRRAALAAAVILISACAHAPSVLTPFNQKNARFVAGDENEEFALVVAGVTVARPDNAEKADAAVIWRRVEDDGAFGVFRRNKRHEVIATTEDVLFRTKDGAAAWSLHWVEPGTYAMDGGELSRSSIGTRAEANLRDGQRLAFTAEAGQIVFIGLASVPVKEDPTVDLARVTSDDFNAVKAGLAESAPGVVGEPQPASFSLVAVPCVEAYQPLAYHQHCT